ncbi:MAG: ChbG/HpnK family deacetylase [Candidatus Sabulitectum sp.]|nr:ChbG/HpnK family deacetylase [Candidatus Sabulitectum sp.]
MREITVTIDDGGMHPAVNAAIRKCIEFGNVSRVSIMATGSNCAEACMMAMTGSVRVAAHLDCCRGPFILEKSNFPESFATWIKSADSLADSVKKEWAAQIEKILSTGGVVTALDSHRHLHNLPALQKVIISLARDYGIRTVRTAVLPDKYMRFPAGIKLNTLGCELKTCLESEGLVTTDRMLGFGKAGKINRRYLKKYTSICSDGTTEIVMHPATEKVWSSGQPAELELITSEWFGDWCRGKH